MAMYIVQHFVLHEVLKWLGWLFDTYDARWRLRELGVECIFSAAG